MDDFEKTLTQMSKPEVTQLRHQELLAHQIIKTQHKNVLSWWWLCIPLYMLAAFFMKSYYAPQTTLRISLTEFAAKNKPLAWLAFVILPLLLLIINSISIYRLAILSGDLKSPRFLKMIIFNVFVIISAIAVLIIFLIN